MAKNPAKKQKEKAVLDTREVDIKVVKKKKPTKKCNTKKILMIILKIAIVVLIIYILTSAKEVTITEEQNYTVPQTKIVQEPYQVIEEYEEKEPYGTKFCVNRPMNFTTTTDKKVGTRNNTIICELNLTNLEDIEGTWIYDAYLETFVGRAEAPEQAKTVGPYETVTYSWEIEMPPGAKGANCIIFVKTQPSMKKCFYPEPVTYRLVTKTRTVTKYRNVTKTEYITMTNTTTKTKYINKFFGYEQGYYFGW
ncbi:MAG: hypothetical protein QXG86_02045 [Candidatus Woesearchaeota archaeon]